MSYRQYLTGEKWKRNKKKFQMQIGHKTCRICYTIKQIDTHHLTYKNLGKEKYQELVFLCREHHFSLHRLMNKEKIYGKEALYEMNRKYQASKLK